MRENEDKMEELESSLFSQRSSFRSNRGSVSVAFLFPPQTIRRTRNTRVPSSPPCLDCTNIHALSFVRGGSE